MTTAIVLFLVEHLFSIAGFLLAVALLHEVSREYRRPGGAIAWVLAIVLIPYVGVPLYLLIGGRKLRRRVAKKDPIFHAADYGADSPPRNNTERVLCAAGMPPPRPGNRAVLVRNGEVAYHELVRLIEEARASIHATTFILGRDDVGRDLVARLARRAADGVEVRLLLDSLGCVKTSRGFVDPIRRAGGRVGVFLPVLPLRRQWSANLRNHRKIVVADGAEAMVGGMNLSTRFLGPRPDPGRFLDAAVFLRGPAVADVEAVFAADWHFATGETLPSAPPAPADAGGAVIQVAASGPDVPHDVLHDAFMTAMMDARERLWVVTPYFVPDEALLKALVLQARMGRDVRVIVPARSNHRIADFARGPALRALHGAGAKIFAYRRGMNHAKLLLFDSQLAVTGSPNLDMRSMYLNFEIALFHTSREEIDHAATWIRHLQAQSDLLDTSEPGLLRGWAEGVGSLVSPLL